VQGVKASLSEQGAQRVGKDYEIEPVAVDGGVFHPKITMLGDGEDCHLLVGSGNLTFNGWGGNCEILEHLHPSFAADAINDAAGFFEIVADTDRVRLKAAAPCAAVAADLRRAATGRPSPGNIRFIHNLTTSLQHQIAQFAEDLGGATRLVAMAPYFDGGTAIDSLCGALGVSKALIHAHEHGTVEGTGPQNWPRGGKKPVEAVCLDVFDKKEERRLHAKAFEILCKRGRIVISGSANGTTAALGAGQNVEACVVRLQRARTTGWRYSAAKPLAPLVHSDDQDDSAERGTGVLRATLDADRLEGEVLTPRMTGKASVFLVTPTGPELLADTTLSAEGAFSVTAPLLEERSWTGGRLVVRVQDARGRQADGFVSVASFGDITRRTGLLSRRLFALLSGTETPADVAAIMSWFHEDPERLASAAPIAAMGGGGGDKSDKTGEQLIPVAALGAQYTEGAIAAMAHTPSSQRNWTRFMDSIMAAFRGARTPFAQTVAGGVGDDDDDDDDGAKGGDSGDAPTQDPAVEKSLAVFERLFALLLKPDSPPRNALIALDLTQYVCARLRPDEAQVRTWLDRLVRTLLATDVPPERRRDVAAVVFALAATSAGNGVGRWARDCLLRLHVDLTGPPPDPEAAAGFASVLPQKVSFNDIWQDVQRLRTYHEQVRAYLQALEKGVPSESDYPDLRRDAREEWPTLEAALADPKQRQRLAISPRAMDACPKCFIRLPAADAARLRSMGIATARGCCSRIVIWAGD
jgi:hypothetical protein